MKSTGDEEMMKLARKVKAHTVTADEIAQLVAFTFMKAPAENASEPTQSTATSFFINTAVIT